MNLSKITKRISLIFISSIFFVNTMVMPFSVVKAADEAPSPWYAQSIFEWIPKVYDSSNPSEIFGERYTAAQTQWVLWGVATAWLTFLPSPAKNLAICAMSNIGSASNGELCMGEIAEFVTWFNEQTADSSTQNMASRSPILNAISTNPISGIKYTKDIINKFNPVQEVNAQGFGFNTGADSIKALWQATRNISYTLLVLAVIAMSFMIMFRIKMSPQLVISVQSAIPNIVFTTILITFSYAIAGFVIDLMYVTIGIVASLLVNNGFTSHNFTDMFGELNLTHSAFALMYKYWLLFVISAFFALIANLGSFIMGILVFVFALISILAVLWWSIKIIYVLLKNFALIVLTIAIGPLEILIGAFTGKSTFGGWLRKLISHLAVYPLMGIIFFFSFFFLMQGSKDWLKGPNFIMPFNPVSNTIDNNKWFPPFSGSLTGSASTGALADNILWVVVSFVIFSNATKAVEIIQGMITGKGFDYGSAIGEGATPVIGGVNYASSAQQGKYANLVKSGNPISPNAQRAQDIWAAIRGLSGGRIK